MDPTVGPRDPVRYYRTPSRFAREAAPTLGLEPVTVEQLVHGRAPIQDRFAVLVRTARHLGDAAMEARLMGPVRAALADLPALPLDAPLIRTATAADLREDQSRVAYLLELARDPRATADELQRWLGDVDTTLGRMVELRSAIVAHLESL